MSLKAFAKFFLASAAAFLSSSLNASSIALNLSTGKIFEEIFRDSLILEIYWEEKINYIIDQSSKNKNLETISFFKLIRKYFSKKIRGIIKKN